MKISVILITYNQEQYIAQALKSIFKQNAPFDVEIIVADDSSIDKTLDIIESYTPKSPFNLKFLPKKSNLGFVKNYQRAFNACDGDYVAILEGDDYWTSPDHLEQHINFLENYPECPMSYNRHLRLFVDQGIEELPEWTAEQDIEYITLEQQILQNRIGNLSCCVFRGKHIKELDQKLFDLTFADWMLGIYMAQFGNLAHHKDITSAYRIHDNGQWSKMSEEEQYKSLIEAIEVYNKFFDYKYNDAFMKHKKRLEILLYGDKSVKGRIKSITPEMLHRLYRKIIK